MSFWPSPISAVSAAVRLWLPGDGNDNAVTQFEVIRAASPFWAVGLAGRDLYQLIGLRGEAHACRRESIGRDFSQGMRVGTNETMIKTSGKYRLGRSITKLLWISCRVSSVLDRAGGFYLILINLLMIFSTGMLQ